jgi:hypothetical protein
MTHRHHQPSGVRQQDPTGRHRGKVSSVAPWKACTAGVAIALAALLLALHDRQARTEANPSAATESLLLKTMRADGGRFVDGDAAHANTRRN